ncbi:ABC transporter ATP-binding protein [Pseudactinotalea terrae]|uniref:ABC transporter ATP-binding protein n=1 Tax=Pseudactinotalea terrae TaxID=1743262 RepID=UPI0012E16F96|nr:ABC transporter ATP-binding protein [Pseudactinotalea terrae]
MIRLTDVTLTYPGAKAPVLEEVSFAVEPGELVLVVGGTGSGKSTLLAAITGRFPHSTGGELRGQVRVSGRDTREHRPRDLADVVGVVGQDPEATFVTGTVEAELAYTLEQLGLPAAVMRTRVEATLDQLGLSELRNRALDELSGGEQQRVAIGAVLTAHPQVLVLDEPTSALDPAAAEDVLSAVHRLVHDLGLTVVLAEHRIERVAGLVDKVVLVKDGRVRVGAPAALLPEYEGAPPVVALGRLAGWQPVPITVREARRQAGPLAARLGAAPVAPARRVGERLLSARRVSVRHGVTTAVDHVDLDLHAGEVVALMGRNGAGKSSLLWALQGSGRRASGTVRLADGVDTAGLSPEVARSKVTLLPQPASDLLYLPGVAAECAAADGGTGRARAELDALVPGIGDDTDPRDLSEGQRLALALAVQLSADAAVVLLDEPTRGLDGGAKAVLAARIREVAGQGRVVVVTTHDVEFAATCADRVVVLAGGQVVADGAATDVLRASPMLAPQVAKVLPDAGVLTVADVATRLAARDG